jgi:hypothetical protein
MVFSRGITVPVVRFRAKPVDFWNCSASYSR